MAKLNLDFVLLDESVVMYGFRTLMSGAQLEQFKRNPVMLFMHSRADSGPLGGSLETSAVLPIGKWDEVRVQDNKLLAKPIFDDDDDFAKRIEGKVKNGYLNAGSIWLDPIDVSDDPTLKLPGQKGPTITKWGLFEASIVDVPNCQNALAIRTNKGETLQLFGGKDERAVSFLNSMLSTPSGTPSLRVLETVDAAIRAGKFSWSEREALIKLAQVDYNTVSGLCGRIEPLLNDSLAQSVELKELMKLSGRELFLQDKLEQLKALSLPHFLSKYKEWSGLEYPGHTAPAPVQQSALPAAKAELSELLKLNGRDLYMQGKLERLKELSLPDFKAKHKEYFGSEYAGI